MKFRKVLTIIIFLFAQTSMSADLQSLTTLFQTNYNQFYKYGDCEANITRLIEAARNKNIDLSNAFMAKITGAGFLETSGFYTPEDPNQWRMLGYFHYVLIADNQVFDFDLHGGHVMSVEKYVRLQFTPPTMDYKIGNKIFRPENELRYWTIESFNVDSVGMNNKPELTWKKGLTEFISLNEILQIPRDSILPK